MSGRPINLPELPLPDLEREGAPGWEHSDEQIIAYARAAVEADRRQIVVTDDDLAAFTEVYDRVWRAAMGKGGGNVPLRAALEAYAARLRGEP